MYTTVYSIIGIEYLDGESGNMNRGNLANFINIYDVHTTFSYWIRAPFKNRINKK